MLIIGIQNVFHTQDYRLSTLPVPFTFALQYYIFTVLYFYCVIFFTALFLLYYIFTALFLLYYTFTVLYFYFLFFYYIIFFTVLYVYCIMHCIRVFGESVCNLCCIDMVLHSKRPVVHMHPEFTILWLEFRWCNLASHRVAWNQHEI